MVAKGAAEGEITMETIVVTIKGVRVFVDEDAANVQLTLDKPIKGFARNAEGEFVETQVSTISLHRSRLTAQLCEGCDEIALYRATRERAFGQKEFGVILFGAKLKLTRDRKTAGDVIGEGDSAHSVDRDCYITNVVGVQLSDRALRQLDAATAL